METNICLYYSYCVKSTLSHNTAINCELKLNIDC